MNSQELTSQTASGEQLPPRLADVTGRKMFTREQQLGQRGFCLSANQIGSPSGRRVAEHCCVLGLCLLQGEEEGEGAGRAVEEAGGLGAEAGP